MKQKQTFTITAQETTTAEKPQKVCIVYRYGDALNILQALKDYDINDRINYELIESSTSK